MIGLILKIAALLALLWSLIFGALAQGLAGNGGTSSGGGFSGLNAETRIESGTLSFTGTGATTAFAMTFPVSFPAACTSVTITLSTGNWGAVTAVSVTAFSTTGFTLNTLGWTPANGSVFTISYIATGH